eukprot:evm.model.scf_19.4 EVM.evm.TU.scf_19.4   scf_19:54331-70557(+)
MPVTSRRLQAASAEEGPTEGKEGPVERASSENSGENHTDVQRDACHVDPVDSHLADRVQDRMHHWTDGRVGDHRERHHNGTMDDDFDALGRKLRALIALADKVKASLDAEIADPPQAAARRHGGGASTPRAYPGAEDAASLDAQIRRVVAENEAREAKAARRRREAEIRAEAEKTMAQDLANQRCREAERQARAAEERVRVERAAAAQADQRVLAVQEEAKVTKAPLDAEAAAKEQERLRLEAQLAREREGHAPTPKYWSSRRCSNEQPVLYIDIYKDGRPVKPDRQGHHEAKGGAAGWAPGGWLCLGRKTNPGRRRKKGQGARAASAEFDEGVAVMTDGGVSHEDAVAALREFDGDVSEAVAFQIECLADGGAAAVIGRRGGGSAEELEKVLERFAAGGLARTSVVCVRRVQNQRMWDKYYARRREIEDIAGARAVNEQLLWHGSSLQALEIITREGFDFRVSSLAGSFGAGTYFSPLSATSHHYTMRQGGLGGAAALRVPNGAGHAMLLCRVALGRIGQGASGLRRPPDGADSVANNLGSPSELVIFDNAQAYPEYIVFYRQ